MEEMVRETGLSVIASGGIGKAEDIRALHGTGVSGVIVGKALYLSLIHIWIYCFGLNSGVPVPLSGFPYLQLPTGTGVRHIAESGSRWNTPSWHKPAEGADEMCIRDSVSKTRFQQLAKLLAFLRGKARVAHVRLWIFQVDFSMRNVQISAENNRL